MAYVDLNTLHNPATGTSPPATWGDQVRDNFEHLFLRGPYICTSATRPGSPFEGQLIFETDTEKYMGYSGSAWWCVAIIGTGTTTHTPQIDQGASTNIAKTTTYSQYRIKNGECEWWFKLDPTAAGTAGTGFTLTLPVTSAISTAGVIIGNGLFFDTSASTLDAGAFIVISSTTVGLIVSEGTTGTWGASPNLAIASGDSIRGHLRYLVAAAA